jgi:clan AA aspartic protease (TIGR02281 family)
MLPVGPFAHADVVRLDRVAGELFAVPVVVNEKTVLRFTIDSASSDVSISANVFSTLMRSGALAPEDRIDTQNYRLANGTEQRSLRVRFRSLRIGNVVIRDVIGSVATQDGDLLLGQSFLSRLRSWSIDNDLHLLLLNESQSARPLLAERPGIDGSEEGHRDGPGHRETAQAPDRLFLGSIAYLLTGEDSGSVRAVNGAPCDVEIRHRVWPDAPELVSVIHLDNVDRNLSSMRSFPDVPRNRVDITLRGDTVVDYLARPAFTHGSQKIPAVPAHSASETTITLYTDDFSRVRGAWDYVYSHGCTGSDSLRSARTAARF